MQQLAEVCESVAATTKKTEKVALVAAYFANRKSEEAAQAAIFLSGRAFPAWEERTLQVGGALLWRAVAQISRKSENALRAPPPQYGDMGSPAQEIFHVAPQPSPRSIAHIVSHV